MKKLISICGMLAFFAVLAGQDTLTKKKPVEYNNLTGFTGK